MKGQAKTFQRHNIWNSFAGLCTLFQSIDSKSIIFLFLNNISKKRLPWMLLALTAFTLELFALWFQHVMLLRPCVMCIYERCALLDIMFAGLIGAIGLVVTAEPLMTATLTPQRTFSRRGIVVYL